MLKNPLLLQWFRFNIRCEAQPRLLRCGSAPLSMKHGLLHWIFMHILSIIVRVSVPKPFSVCALVLFPFPCFPHLSPHLSSVLCRFVTCAVPSEGKLDQEYYVDSGESKAPLNLSTKPTQNSNEKVELFVNWLRLQVHVPKQLLFGFCLRRGVDYCNWEATCIDMKL